MNKEVDESVRQHVYSPYSIASNKKKKLTSKAQFEQNLGPPIGHLFTVMLEQFLMTMLLTLMMNS